MAAAQIYDEDGNLLRTDDEELQGKAIVMNEKDFKQGMSHEEALKKNPGAARLKGDEAKSYLLKSYNSLPSRPDYDGHLTLAKANEWFRTGNVVELSQFDYQKTLQNIANDTSSHRDSRIFIIANFPCLGEGFGVYDHQIPLRIDHP